ncbi:lysocardiolipin acyltransferase 1-like [Anoplophora glabripennis]|uniref:lysocardiolipin acyltransferase 1-like n=1 Tax=Anoplophora glabripennis TaxID=217634 RepID=UPI0008744462|nr:lysocardiolipin acyltransferase 1-like [Anoplophora glabripennis]
MAAGIGWLYCFLWFSSILAGYASLFCPLLPVMFISNKLYRYITDILFTYWQYYPTAMLEILCGCDIQVSGDPVQTGETSILIMNHRTRTDWNFFWPTLYHSVVGKGKLSHSTKFVLKDVIRHIPGPGWVMQLACFVYIKRCWLLDKEILQRYVDYVADISYKHSLLVFPEGTDFTEDTKKNSDDFAARNNIQKYDYVLHPRTKGFTFLAHQLLLKNNLDAVYDVTLVYPDTVPQREKVLLMGYFPRVVKVHFARYPKSVLPKSEPGLKEFLERRWLDKERTIKEFYATGHFLHGQILKTDRRWELYLALLFWSLLPYVTLYSFAVSEAFRNMVIANTIFLVAVNIFSGGFQNFEIALYNLKRWK